MEGLEVSFDSRKEHLSATPLPEYIKKQELENEMQGKIANENLEKKNNLNSGTSRFVIANQDSNNKDKEVEDLEEKFRNYKTGYRNIPDYEEEPVEEWKEAKQAFSDFTTFRPSLDRPSLSMSFEEYTSASLSNEPLHLGRCMDLSDCKKSSFSSTLWMYEPQNHATDLETLTFNVSKIVSPLLHLLGMRNEHIRSFNQFIDASKNLSGGNNGSIPPGIPVQIDIPIGYGFPLSARIKFHGVEKGLRWNENHDESFWEVPGPKDGYREGEVIAGNSGSN